MLNYKIAELKDLYTVQKLAAQIFPDTYNEILSSDQVEYMFDMMYSIENLQKQFESQTFVIINNGDVAVGYLSIEQLSQNSFNFQKIYLVQNMQGMGLGRYIIDIGLGICSKIAGKSDFFIELFVNRHNKAVEFYKHIGFKVIEERDFHIGDNYYMNDYIMKLKISKHENNLL